ncbi:hypothetical protein L3N51_02354 [Metallosphaera sp. J1]|uniref:hypothetical protein n=1 Tax=Metallosphaera javensis (ex Hofmann et al. 2022) TaxID=99938 RepID=UPI001EDEABE6|nr:hypothetical protein [Metallosphaera javensis (ex Hofmann et al. 2022)]MCG3110057.1 hypothetical protein [Metallosphaera javensis (ex Hofmann et al. 2022)]
MTFVISMVAGQGVIFASDSRATSGAVFEEERKILPIFVMDKQEVDLAVVAGAGNASIVKQSFQIISRHFTGYYQNMKVAPEGEELDRLVDQIQDTLMTRFQYLRQNGIQPDVSILLGTLSGCEPRLYSFDSTGLYEPRHYDPGYEMIGIGRDTGGLTLLNLLGYSKDKNWDMGLLTMFLIDVIARVNPYVSPVTSFIDSMYLRCENGRRVMGPLQWKAFRRYKKSVEKRIEIIRTVWELGERLGDDSVLEALKKLAKE